MLFIRSHYGQMFGVSRSPCCQGPLSAEKVLTILDVGRRPAFSLSSGSIQQAMGRWTQSRA